MLNFQQVVTALQQGAPDAPAQLERLARSGDVDALYMLGEFRLTGLHGPVDTKAAYRMIGRAAKDGHVDARRTHAYLTAAGTGCVADAEKARQLLQSAARTDRFAEMQLQLDAVFSQEVLGAEREILRDDPLIYVVRNFLSPNQCKYVRMVAQPWLAPAMIVHPITGEGMLDPIRRSETMNFGPVFEDLIIQRINRRIAEATNTPLANGEPLSVLHYNPGQEYRAHLDAFDLAEPGAQRAVTALIWLNDGFEGGATRFPELELDFVGNPGDLFVFRNVDAEGKCDRRTMHSGMPVTGGEKWLASRWIRDGAYFG